ncbi:MULTISPECIES: IS3 family transposase [Exiguobacterium]|uniref:IS3 family transposase n=2 Tax=Exiguobacterium acetylicum TaxID=41170 RepID=A0ABX8G7M6_EXIAC|nr:MULTISPECIES: IS3 family transposase [Exiguobacterium]QWB29182.1 IS3 family transposase [Exiguobacterium acetylicum]
MGKNVYSSEVKWAVVKDKLSGKLTTREIMEKYGIKNESQIKTWMRWYRSNKHYRFDQPIGKQYTYGHGPDSASEDDKRERQMSHLKMENEILKKVHGNRKRVEKEVVIKIVEFLRRKYTITAILSALNVPRASYYRWIKESVKAPSVLEKTVIELSKQTKYRNGHRKIKALLQQIYQLKANRNTVQKIMQKHHLQCRIKPKRRWKSQGERIITAPDLIKRDFTASKPNQKWVTDITYIQYGSTTKYLSTIMDLFNNEIVAYKLYEHQQTSLVIDTLKIALENRNYPEGVILHSDQGSVYTSYAFQEFVKRNHLTSSMSRRGNCWDNAVIESFHSNLKSEEFQYVKFNSLRDHEVSERVTNYLNYYNEERIQEKLGYLTPKKYGVQAA